MQHIYLGAWIVVSAMIAYQDIHHCHDLPWPPRFIYAAIVFGMLDIAGGFIPELAALMAGGMVLAFGLCTLRPNSRCGGFHASCDHHGTEQPASYQFIQGSEAETATTDSGVVAGPSGGMTA